MEIRDHASDRFLTKGIVQIMDTELCAEYSRVLKC